MSSIVLFFGFFLHHSQISKRHKDAHRKSGRGCWDKRKEKSDEKASYKAFVIILRKTFFYFF